MSQAFDSKSQKMESPVQGTTPDTELESLRFPTITKKNLDLVQGMTPPRTEEPKTPHVTVEELRQRTLDEATAESAKHKKEQEDLVYGKTTITGDEPSSGYMVKEPDPFEKPNDRYIREKLEDKEKTKHFTIPLTEITKAAARHVVGNPPAEDSLEKESSFRTAARKVLDKIPTGISAEVDDKGTVTVSAGFKKEW